MQDSAERCHGRHHPHDQDHRGHRAPERTELGGTRWAAAVGQDLGFAGGDHKSSNRERGQPARRPGDKRRLPRLRRRQPSWQPVAERAEASIDALSAARQLEHIGHESHLQGKPRPGQDQSKGERPKLSSAAGMAASRRAATGKTLRRRFPAAMVAAPPRRQMSRHADRTCTFPAIKRSPPPTVISVAPPRPAPRFPTSIAASMIQAPAPVHRARPGGCAQPGSKPPPRGGHCRDEAEQVR